MKRLASPLLLILLALLACKGKPKAGEACKNEGEASCQDPTTIISCTSGKWESVACRGPDGCKAEGPLVKCDETLSQEGDPCGSQKDEHFSCSTDKTHELRCEAGKWKTVGKCGGPKGCEAKFPFVECDNSVSEVGDLCGKENDAACSKDMKSILECKGGKFAVSQKCDEGSCKAEGLFVKCE